MPPAGIGLPAVESMVRLAAVLLGAAGSMIWFALMVVPVFAGIELLGKLLGQQLVRSLRDSPGQSPGEESGEQRGEERGRLLVELLGRFFAGLLGGLFREL